MLNYQRVHTPFARFHSGESLRPFRAPFFRVLSQGLGFTSHRFNPVRNHQKSQAMFFHILAKRLLQYWDFGEKLHVFWHAFLTSNQPQIVARNPSYETWRFKSNPKFPKPEHVRTEASGCPEVDCTSDTKKKCLWHYIVYIHNHTIS